MTESKTSGMTPEARIAWPNLFEARLNDLNGKMEYSCQLLISKDDPGLPALKACAAAAAEKKWGGNVPKNLRSPFRDGDIEKEDQEDYRGMIFINLKSNQKPGVVNESVEPVIDPAELMAGDYVRVTFNAFGYNQKGNKGVSLGLRNVQRIRKGEPLAGARTRAEDDFGSVTGAGDDVPMSAEEASRLADTLF